MYTVKGSSGKQMSQMDHLHCVESDLKTVTDSLAEVWNILTTTNSSPKPKGLSCFEIVLEGEVSRQDKVRVIVIIELASRNGFRGRSKSKAVLSKKIRCQVLLSTVES